MDQTSPRVAVLIPCYNEEVAIGSVVDDFRAALPDAAIYVYDNNSTDRTVDIAREHGAVVRSETRQGKGHVVRRMFSDVEADIYVLVDGDATYDAASAPELVAKLLGDGLDMVSASRRQVSEEAYRRGHVFGNRILTGLVALLFGARLKDMLSGYRVFSRRFVKSFPALARGFEIETELTVHALSLRMPMAEVETPYRERQEGSDSKLNTWRDGFRILMTIFQLVKEERPLPFFLLTGLALVVLSLIIGSPVVAEFLRSGTVPKLPSAILATGLMLLGFLGFTCGMILDTVTHGRLEIKRLAYLRYPGPQN
ncbi:MAG: glycosyltransferase family 2 protein [Pseudomonadota bacterium]